MHTGDTDSAVVPPGGVHEEPRTLWPERPATAGGAAAIAARGPRWWPRAPAAILSWRPPASLQGLAALTIFTAFWVGLVVPALVIHPGALQLDQSSMDPNFFVWSLRWWPYAIGHGLDPMTTRFIGAPGGFNLAWLTTVPVVAVLAAPVTAAFGPVVTLNLLTAFAPPVAGWAAFVLCRRLTGRFWPSLAGGAVYGYSAYEMNHSVPGHLNLTVSLLVPLISYLVVRWRDGAISREAFIGLLAAALVLQMLLFLETFAGLTVIWLAALSIGYWLAGPAARPRIAQLGRQAGVAYLVAVVIGSPYLGYVLTHTPAGFARNVPRTNALNLASLIVPRPTRTFRLHWLHDTAAALPTASQAGYIGIPLLLLAAALAVWAWKDLFTRFVIVMFVFAVLVAAGPDLAAGTLHALPVPWALAWKLPLARSAFPVRFMVFADLALAVIVALWLAAPLRHALLRWMTGLLAVAVVLVNIPFITAPQPTPSSQLPGFIASGQFRHYLTHGEIVLVISARGNAGLLFQAVSDFYFRISGGFVNQAMTPRSDLPRPIQYLQTPSKPVEGAALDYLEDSRVGAVLFENRFPEPAILSAFHGMGLRGRVLGGVTMFQIPRDAS